MIARNVTIQYKKIIKFDMIKNTIKGEENASTCIIWPFPRINNYLKITFLQIFFFIN